MTVMQLRSGALALAMLGLATPLYAQDGLCGGIGANGLWIAGDEAASDIATSDGFQEQMALVLGGNDYVSLFTLSAPTDVRVEAEGRGSGDPLIDLLGADGGVILTDDDSGGNSASRAETTLEAGTYCLSTRSYDGGPMTAFVRIGRQEHEPLTDGVINIVENTDGGCAEAADLGTLGASMASSANETPFWRFTLDAPAAVTIIAENEDADPTITVYDANDAYLADNDDFDGLNSRIDFTEALDAGQYCIEVGALSDDSAPITVSLSAYDEAEALQGLYARGELAPPLDGSVEVTALGLLETRLLQNVTANTDVSWFSVEIPEAGMIVVEAVGAGSADPWLIIYDDLGRQVGMNDDHGNDLNSLVMARVQPGTYIIGLRKFNEGQGFVRLLAERFVPAK